MSQIQEGMSESRIRDCGGYVGADNRVYDRDGGVVWTPRGDLVMKNGEAKPENRS